MRISLLILAALLLAGSPAFAKTASETASDYFKVLQQKDYDRAATFFDPAALGEFRRMMSFTDEIPAEGQKEFFEAFFGPGASRESVAKLSDARFFASFLRAVMAQAEALGGLNFDRMQILGEVTEGKDVAHVVTRNKVSVGKIEVEAMEVASFRKVGSEWKALLSGKIKGVASQIRAALQGAGE
jgi:hypothetical protein